MNAGTNDYRGSGARAGTIEYLELWTFADPSLGDIDLTGFHVEAEDGGIGKIDEATYADDEAHVVVDTGPWIFGKKVILPAGVIRRIDLESETVFVNRTKDEIKNAPQLDESTAMDATYRSNLAGYYATRSSR